MPKLLRPARKQRNRKGGFKGQRYMGTDIVPVSVEFTTPNVAITFPSPIVLSGIPAFVTNTAKSPTTAVRTSPTVLTLTYDTPGAAVSITVPYHDPAVRFVTGGFVTEGEYTFPDD